MGAARVVSSAQWYNIAVQHKDRGAINIEQEGVSHATFDFSVGFPMALWETVITTGNDKHLVVADHDSMAAK